MDKNPETVTFDFKDVVTAMIREKGLTEGIWQLYVEFKLTAANMPFRDEANPNSPKGPADGPPDFLFPSVLAPLTRLGLLRVPAESQLAVDAAKVRPKRKITATKPAPKKKK